ncbi:MAG: DUF3817 domain-containing protein [Campylobacterota bacterium]|nr:DUF3817 domain-containing protein [Campylobacterota bacterium]
MIDKTLDKFRLVATIEGISFLVLLFIAMPLKYMFGFPIATKIVGMIHGGLFMWYLYELYNAHSEYKWNIKFTLWAFVASLIPFGTFYLEKQLKAMKQES